MQRTLHFTHQLGSRASFFTSSSFASSLMPLKSTPRLSHLVICRCYSFTTSSLFAVEDTPKSNELNDFALREPPPIG
jgi:hypothetical protein